MCYILSKQERKDLKKVSWKVSKLSEEEKNKKRGYDRKRDKNLSEDEKHKLVEYRKVVMKCVKKCEKNKNLLLINTDWCFIIF